MEKFLHIHRGHNSHGYSKSRLGCFNGSLYIFPFTRSMGKKWTLGVLLIEFEKSNSIDCFIDRSAKIFEFSNSKYLHIFISKLYYIGFE